MLLDPELLGFLVVTHAPTMSPWSRCVFNAAEATSIVCFLPEAEVWHICTLPFPVLPCPELVVDPEFPEAVPDVFPGLLPPAVPVLDVDFPPPLLADPVLPAPEALLPEPEDPELAVEEGFPLLPLFEDEFLGVDFTPETPVF